MDRRSLLFSAAAALAAAPFAATAGSAGKTAKPNIIRIMCDDWDTRQPITDLPSAKKLLADKGVTFENSFVNYSLCIPSRVSHLTGMSAHVHGIFGEGTPETTYDAYRVLEDNALPVWLQAAGYKVGLYGKLMNGFGETEPTHVPPGYDDFHSIATSTGPFRYTGFKLNDNGVINQYKKSDYITDTMTVQANDFITRCVADAQPFFIDLWTIAPHGSGAELGAPQPPERYMGLYDSVPWPRPWAENEADMSDKPAYMQDFPLQDEAQMAREWRRRQETMLAVDDQIAAVVAKLKELGQLNNTYIMLTSDNGWLQGEHRIRGKVYLYEESMRVPLIIRGPGIAAAQQFTEMVNNLDLIPTICEWAGATPGRVCDGMSLRKMLHGVEKRAPRTAILFENKFTTGVRALEYLYAETPNEDLSVSKELYDLRRDRDPTEMTSLHDDPAWADVMSFCAARLPTMAHAVGGKANWVTAAFPPPPA